VQTEFKNEVSDCQSSAAAGNSFENSTRKRGANSVRMPSHEFDPSNPRFAAQKDILEGGQRMIEKASSSDRCTLTGAYDALMRAVETRSTEYGNWCGVGSEKGTCCEVVCPDGGYDALCRKHDSSTYHETWFGITVSPCACDEEFVTSSQQFDSCIGGKEAAWRVEPDPTGKVTCEETRDAAVNTFLCMPCLNFECEKGKWDYGKWEFTTECEWISYWTNYPEQPACDGECWDSSMKPWSYQHWYDKNICD